MKMSKTHMLVFFGFLTWLLPFVASFFFYDPSASRMTINNDFFKSIMVVFSALVGTLLLVKYFDSVKKDYVKEGLIAGLAWAAMNWVLDFVVLVPMMKVDTPTYFMSIGLRYLMAPIIAVGMGMAIENEKTRMAAGASALGKKMATKLNRKK